MVHGKLADVGVERVAGAVRESPINILLPRSGAQRDQPTSLWAVIFELLHNTSQERDLIDLAAVLASELSVLAALDGSNAAFPRLVSQLLGNGRGLAFVRSRHVKPSAAFTIARHASSFDPIWWSTTKRELLSGTPAVAWSHATGYKTAAAFIQAVETAGPCAACTDAVARSKNILEDPGYPGRVHAKRHRRRGWISSDVAEPARGAWKGVSRAPPQQRAPGKKPTTAADIDSSSTHVSLQPGGLNSQDLPPPLAQMSPPQSRAESLFFGHTSRRSPDLADIIAPETPPMSPSKADLFWSGWRPAGNGHSRWLPTTSASSESIARGATVPSGPTRFSGHSVADYPQSNDLPSSSNGSRSASTDGVDYEDTIVRPSRTMQLALSMERRPATLMRVRPALVRTGLLVLMIVSLSNPDWCRRFSY